MQPSDTRAFNGHIINTLTLDTGDQVFYAHEVCNALGLNQKYTQSKLTKYALLPADGIKEFVAEIRALETADFINWLGDDYSPCEAQNCVRAQEAQNCVRAQEAQNCVRAQEAQNCTQTAPQAMAATESIKNGGNPYAELAEWLLSNEAYRMQPCYEYYQQYTRSTTAPVSKEFFDNVVQQRMEKIMLATGDYWVGLDYDTNAYAAI